MKEFALVLAGIFAIPLASAASFDCQKAARPIEKMICSDGELSALDEKLSVVCERTIATSTNKAAEISDQKQWLRNNRDKCGSSSCAIEAYQERLAVLENKSGAYAEIPGPMFIKTLCGKLMSQPVREKILSERDGVDDVNNDGRMEVAHKCDGGTMHTPCTDYFDSQGKRISVKEVNYDRLDWVLGASSFRYAGRTFTLLFSDYEMQKPISLTYVTPLNEEHALCKFNTVVSSALPSGKDTADPVCKAVLNHSDQVHQITFSNEPDFQFDTNKQPWLYANKSGSLDIDNDGTPENVVEVHSENGGGRGCSFNYFDILNASGTKLLLGAKRSRFLAQQGVPESGGYIMGCGNIENRLFRYQSHTYFESNVTQSEGNRTVSILKDGNAKTVCNFVRAINVEGFKQVGEESMYFND